MELLHLEFPYWKKPGLSHTPLQLEVGYVLHLLHFHIRTWSGWEPRYSGVLGSKGSQRMELGGAGFPEPEV